MTGPVIVRIEVGYNVAGSLIFGHIGHVVDDKGYNDDCP